MKTTTLLMTVGLLSSAAIAQMQTSQPEPMPSDSSVAASDPSPLAGLQPKTENGVTYLCGGVGEDEANYMKEVARDYGLMLTFAVRDGSYLADIGVEIKDAGGKSVLQAKCDAPILLVDLPKGGTYRVRADAGGYTLNKTVSVRGSRQQGGAVAAAVMTWPQQIAEAPGATQSGSGASGDETEAR